MCGIVGAIGLKVGVADGALTAMRHRGPDGRGSAVPNSNVWLGHCRLSIIDLSASAAQPMHCPHAGMLVFNGEIYDHEAHRERLESDGCRFVTSSDTEVLLRGLASAGPDFLTKLHGMYAFAWLSPDGRRLLLGRDHAGIKPLYVWRGPEGLAFASEVRALAVAIRGLGGTVRSSGRALQSFLTWGSVEEPLCVIEGAEMLATDTVLEIDVGTREIVRTHRVGRVHQSARDDVDPVSSVQGAMHNAVRRHLVADVPVALFLSGGVDSGVLAAELSRSGTHGATAIHVQLGSAGTDDEGAIVERLVERHGLRLRRVSLQDWSSGLGDAINAYDQPSIDGLNTFLIARVARDCGFKVALSGAGADEVFGGYRHLHWDGRGLSLLDAIPLSVAGFLANRSNPRLRRAGIVAEARSLGQPPQRAFRMLMAPSVVRRLLPAATHPLPHPGGCDPLEIEQQTYLRDTLLRDADVMGMASGVEIRVPYLDPEVMEAARAIGSKRLLDPSRPPKWVLRDGWVRDLDPATLTRRKTGFTLSVGQWLQGEGRSLVEGARQGLAKYRCVDQSAAESLWSTLASRLDSGHPSAWAPMFALVQLERQLRAWGEPR